MIRTVSLASIRASSARHSIARSVAVLGLVGLGAVAVFFYAFTRAFPLVENYRVELGWGDLTKFDQTVGYTYLAAMLLLVGLFALAIWLVRDMPYRIARWPIYVVGAAASLTLLLMYPGGSIDVFVYVAFSRVWVHFEANPLVVPAASFPNDPLTLLAAGWANIPAPYGPFWIILSAIPGLFAKADLLKNVLLFKGMAIAFYLGSVAVVSWILDRVSPGRRSLGTLLYAWNPVILIETVGNGHNDGVMMFFVLAAIALSLAKSEKWRLASPAVLILASLVKYTTALLLPILYVYHLAALPTWRERARFLGLSGLLAAIVTVVVFAPFWEGPRTLDAALFQNSLTVTTPVWILNQLVKWNLPELQGKDLPQKALLALFGLVYLVQLARVARQPGLWLSVAFETVLLSLYAVGKFYPWYAVWPLALGAIIPSRRLLGWVVPFSAGVLLWNFFSDFSFQWSARQIGDVFRTELIVVALVFVLPGLVWLGLWLRDGRAVRGLPLRAPCRGLHRQ